MVQQRMRQTKAIQPWVVGCVEGRDGAAELRLNDVVTDRVAEMVRLG